MKIKNSNIYFWLSAVLTSLNIFLTTVLLLLITMYILKVKGLGYSYTDFFKFINSLDPAAWFITIVVGWVVNKLTSDLTNSINYNNKQIRILKKSQQMELKEFQDNILNALRTEISGVKGEITGIKGEITGLKGEITGVNDRLDKIDGRLDSLENNQNNILDILTKSDSPSNIEPN